MMMSITEVVVEERTKATKATKAIMTRRWEMIWRQIFLKFLLVLHIIVWPHHEDLEARVWEKGSLQIKPLVIPRTLQGGMIQVWAHQEVVTMEEVLVAAGQGGPLLQQVLLRLGQKGVQSRLKE
jgi:hypothetical protein